MPIRPPRNYAHAQKKSWLKKWSLWAWLVLLLFIPLSLVILWKSGRWLVHSDPFEKVSWGLVLAGESRDCERSDAAIKLYHEGRIDSVILSACRIFKTHYQSEYMVDYLAEQGIPKGKIFEFRQDTYSTIEEARALIRQFRYQNLDTVVIITSNYHTARTRRIFRKLAQGYPQVLVYAADFPTYNPDAWWANRESLKYWFNEWIKTVASYFELIHAGSENGKADYQNLLPDIWTKHSEASTPIPLPIPTDTSKLKNSTTAVGSAAVGVSTAGDSLKTNLTPHDSLQKLSEPKLVEPKASKTKSSELKTVESKTTETKPDTVPTKSSSPSKPKASSTTPGSSHGKKSNTEKTKKRVLKTPIKEPVKSSDKVD